MAADTLEDLAAALDENPAGREAVRVRVRLLTRELLELPQIIDDPALRVPFERQLHGQARRPRYPHLSRSLSRAKKMALPPDPRSPSPCYHQRRRGTMLA